MDDAKENPENDSNGRPPDAPPEPEPEASEALPIEPAPDPEPTDRLVIDMADLGPEEEAPAPDDAAPEPEAAPDDAGDSGDADAAEPDGPNRLVVDLADLPDEPATPAANRLVIDASRLPEAPPAPSVGPARPPTGPPGYAMPSAGKEAPTGVLPIFGSRIMEALVAGVGGGFVAWVLGEPLLKIVGAVAEESVARQVVEVALYGMLLGGLIGAALNAVEAVALRAWQRAYYAGAIGLAVGAGGGLIGGLVAQGVNSLLVGSMNISPRSVSGLLLYAVGWSVLGLFIGVSQCVRSPVPDAMRRGILGGAIGGLVGGLAFAGVRLLTGTGGVSRMLAVLLLGVSIGLGVGLVERLLRQAWLKVIGGPLRGKEFILDSRRLVIGSGPSADIILARDPRAGKVHAEIVMERNRHRIRDLGSGYSTDVNGRAVTDHALRPGDVITIGEAAFRYDEQADGSAGGGAGKTPGTAGVGQRSL